MASSIVAVAIEAARMVKSFVIVVSRGWPEIPALWSIERPELLRMQAIPERTP
jgi:hypothetical protein